MSIPERARRQKASPYQEAKERGNKQDYNITQDDQNVSEFYGVKVKLTADFFFGSGGTIAWDGVHFDKGGFWSPTSPTRITVPFTGYYMIWSCLQITDVGTDPTEVSVYRHDALAGVEREVMRYTHTFTQFTMLGTGFQARKGDYFYLSMFNLTSSRGRLETSPSVTSVPATLAVVYLGS